MSMQHIVVLKLKSSSPSFGLQGMDFLPSGLPTEKASGCLGDVEEKIQMPANPKAFENSAFK
jgi:hypothetical protein